MRLLLLGFLVSSLSQASVPPHWEEFSAPGVEKMWKSLDVKEAYVSLMNESSSYTLSDFDPKLYVSGLPEVRSFIHSLIGIRQYKIEKSESVQTLGNWTVKIEGSYLKKNQMKLSFCEIHTFTATGFQQKQLFYPQLESSKVLGARSCFEALSSVVQ